ncbi:MAG: hypothetical protein MPEBLZ_02595 [Candidatus Methanoperedens nitroreducens]|uniref:Uncharacterized protein n=2 Tax=Candidatus Methanoperedens TaxID=1392997 RepID=A0A0P8AF08_9EURY|nr:MAG: hypothetical protein MPEBLZ_02595 [Candidatus Methanoperedens sp. BLZ1]
MIMMFNTQTFIRFVIKSNLFMSEYYNILTKVMANKQMSISSIARELKKNGYDQHRLILTGYLRALHETGYMEEIDIPPSKVYVLKSGMKRDVYSIVKEHLKDIDISERLGIAVFILTSLFHRPSFKYELELLGIEARKTETIKESKDALLNEHRVAVTRIKIPVDDPAFEMNGDTTEIQLLGNKVLIDIIKDLIDLDGLKAKSQQTKLA